MNINFIYYIYINVLMIWWWCMHIVLMNYEYWIIQYIYDMIKSMAKYVKKIFYIYTAVPVCERFANWNSLVSEGHFVRFTKDLSETESHLLGYEPITKFQNLVFEKWKNIYCALAFYSALPIFAKARSCIYIYTLILPLCI